MSKRQSLNKTLLQLDQLTQAQQWQDARPLAEALVEQAPTTPGVIERAVLVLRQLEDWPALTQLLLRARNQYQLWPQGSDLLMGQGMVELAQWSKAIPYLELALEQEASAGWAHHFLGKALRHSGRLEEALEMQSQASAILPEFAWAPFEASQVLMELKQPRQAVLELQEARRRHSTPNAVMEEQWQRLQPLVLQDRVERLIAAGESTEAFALLRQAMAMAPQDEELNQLLTRLLLSAGATPDSPASSNAMQALEQELNAIETLLDLLEAQAEHQASLISDAELSYL